MSVHDLVFSFENETIYDPLTLTSGSVIVSVTNYGDEDLTNLGLYISPASTLGEVDNPADYPPSTDYQDLITWGQRTVLGITAIGGIVITCPQNNGIFSGYITRNQGSMYSNRIPFINLNAGDTVTFNIEFETPTGVAARRFFIDLKLE